MEMPSERVKREKELSLELASKLRGVLEPDSQAQRAREMLQRLVDEELTVVTRLGNVYTLARKENPRKRTYYSCALLNPRPSRWIRLLEYFTELQDRWFPQHKSFFGYYDTSWSEEVKKFHRKNPGEVK